MGGQRPLVIGLCFNAASVIIGGIGLLSHSILPPYVWLLHTPFHSYMVPGLVLLIAVGGSSLVALAAVLGRFIEAGMLALFAGFMMLGWVVIQIIVIKEFDWLQAVYLLTSSFVIIQAA